MLLRFQKVAVRKNYETGNQGFSIRLRFLTIRDQERFRCDVYRFSNRHKPPLNQVAVIGRECVEANPGIVDQHGDYRVRDPPVASLSIRSARRTAFPTTEKLRRDFPGAR